MDIKCHDFLECDKQGCIMFKEGEERNCWDVEPDLTLCSDMFEKSVKLKDKIIFCKNCLFYEHVNKTTHVRFGFKVHR